MRQLVQRLRMRCSIRLWLRIDSGRGLGPLEGRGVLIRQLEHRYSSMWRTKRRLARPVGRMRYSRTGCAPARMPKTTPSTWLSQDRVWSGCSVECSARGGQVGAGEDARLLSAGVPCADELCSEDHVQLAPGVLGPALDDLLREVAQVVVARRRVAPPDVPPPGARTFARRASSAASSSSTPCGLVVVGRCCAAAPSCAAAETLRALQLLGEVCVGGLDAEHGGVDPAGSGSRLHQVAHAGRRNSGSRLTLYVRLRCWLAPSVRLEASDPRLCWCATTSRASSRVVAGRHLLRRRRRRIRELYDPFEVYLERSAAPASVILAARAFLGPVGRPWAPSAKRARTRQTCSA